MKLKLLLSFFLGVMLTSALAYMLLIKLMLSFSQERALIILGELELRKQGYEETIAQKTMSANYAIDEVSRFTNEPLVSCNEETSIIIKKSHALGLDKSFIPSC